MDPMSSETPGLKTGAVVAAHPLAVEAGRQILNQGGNAVDAAVAVSFALNVVEPQASGIGGGGFMLIYPAQGRPVFLDYRERAALASTGQHWNFGGQAVAVPGQLRGIEKALDLFGSKPLGQLVAPAVEYAREGFVVSSVFTELLRPRLSVINRSPAMVDIFLDQGNVPEPGYVLMQPELAATLDLIGKEGIDCFYRGPLAQEIVEAIRDAGGVISTSDLADYQTRVLAPLEGRFGEYSIFTAPPPSTGGTNLLQLLGIWEQFPGEKLGFGELPGIDYLARAMGSVFHHQNHYMGDPTQVDIPDFLLSPHYLRTIAEELAAGKNQVAASRYQSSGTTSFVTADSHGNVVVVTQTINFFFGAGVAVPGRGIILNNQVADFSPVSGSPNAPAPGKTPISNMAPTIVMKDGQLVLALGSPGAKRIVTALGQVLLLHLEGGLSFDEAVHSPRFHKEDHLLHIEGDGSIGTSLEQLGHQVELHPPLDLYFGGVTGLAWEKGRLTGVFDRRRDGDVYME